MKTKLRPRRIKTDRQKQEALLDTLWRDYIRMRAMKRVGGCEFSNTRTSSFLKLQAAHLFPRGRDTIRWEPNAGVGILPEWHRFIDDHPEAKTAFAKRILGEEEYERLYVLSHMTTRQSPIDHKLIELTLRELLKEV